MSRLIIHVGTHKTATTHIQDTFHKSRDLLRQHGVIYPQIGIAHGQHSLATAWVDLPAEYRIEDPRRAWLGLAETYGRSNETVFVSSEELSRLQPTCVDMADMANLVSGFDEVRIVCTLRNQASFMQSIYQELSRSFVTGPWVTMLRRALDKSLIAGFAVDYNLLLDHFLQGFPGDQIKFISYDKAIREKGGILGAFLRELGVEMALDSIDVMSAGRSNVSAPPLANLLANEMSDPKVANPALVRVLSDSIGELIPQDAATTIFSRFEMEQVQNIFSPLNQHLLDRISAQQPDFSLTAIPENAPKLFYREQLNDSFWLGTLRRLAR